MSETKSEKVIIPQPQRHHIVVARNVSDINAHTWSQSIFVPFTPDEVIVRSVSYLSVEVEPYVYVLQCYTLGEPMVVFNNGSTFCPLTIFDLRGKNINTNWQFQLQGITELPASFAAGRLAVLLEFVKH